MNDMAGAAQPDAPRPGAAERAERDELLANLTPEQRQRVMELRKQNQQVLGEMSEQKLLRAVYSERQLEEVLVDFWFNHFNVFAGKGATRDLRHRVRARRDPPARARQLPRPARRDGEEPGDAVLSRQLA